jgi:alpha-tubulin suppressor-like RCC1 family protein
MLSSDVAGAVLAWGCNLQHQSAASTSVSVPEPAVVRTLLGIRITAVEAGLNHSLALSEGGDVYTWGANECGQLGHGSMPAGQATPRLVEQLGSPGSPAGQVIAITSGTRCSSAPLSTTASAKKDALRMPAHLHSVLKSRLYNARFRCS